MIKTILIMYTDYIPSQNHFNILSRISMGYKVLAVNNESDAIKFSEQAEIILGHRYLRQVLPTALNLKWVQSTGGGFDHLPWKLLQNRNILLSRVTFSSVVIAQHSVMLALVLNRKLNICIDSQRNKIWDKEIYKMLLPRPRIALILGFGFIGREIAKILRAMGIEIWAVKRNADNVSKSASDRLYTDNSWIDELYNVDFCFLSLPNDASTKKILSAEVLNNFSSKAIIVNIARGELIDIPELLRLLREGKVGGAGLDVFDGRRPLRKDSPIWNTPNLIVTPYLAARYADRGHDLEKYVEAQVWRYFNGDKLENLVERT